MIALSTFLPAVYLEAEGCPEAVALNAVRNAVRELCHQSLIWSEDLDAISLAQGYSLYDIDIPISTALVRMTARYNGVDVPVFTTAEMDEKYSDWRDDTGSAVQSIVCDSNTEIRIYPTPTAAESSAILLRATLMPSIDATTCANVLADWGEYIAHGALRRLKAMPNKPWTDQASVAYHQGEFATGLDRAIAKVLRGHSSKSAFIRPGAAI